MVGWTVGSVSCTAVCIVRSYPDMSSAASSFPVSAEMSRGLGHLDLRRRDDRPYSSRRYIIISGCHEPSGLARLGDHWAEEGRQELEEPTTAREDLPPALA